jgi:hypothetical protein
MKNLDFKKILLEYIYLLNFNTFFFIFKSNSFIKIKNCYFLNYLIKLILYFFKIILL